MTIIVEPKQVSVLLFAMVFGKNYEGKILV